MKNIASLDNQQHPLNLQKLGSTDSVKLPLLISVPHGGYTVPINLIPQLSVDFTDIFTDCDPCTREIYSFQDEAYYFHETDIARAVVDLNRADHDLPPRNSDGVIKSHTVTGTPVYKPGCQPGREQIEELLERYYYPYHEKITRDSTDPALICALDCHSMLEIPPGETDGKQHKRPFICLSNCGDENGEGDEDELSCPSEMIQLMADCMREAFPEEADSIVLNEPFKGGHLSRVHCRELPWIQVELNRRAYLSAPWFNPRTLQVNAQRIGYLRWKFLQAFTTFCDEAANLVYLKNGDMTRQPDFLENPFLF